MTDLHLPRLDLARAVTDALGRGRYVLMTDGGGSPLEITLDLKERDDDAFEDADNPLRARNREDLADAISREDMERQWERGVFSGDPLWASPPADDHGASVPTQGELHRSAEVVGEDGGWAVRESGPIVYEFALQDIGFQNFDGVGVEDAPDNFAAAAADWVHVYDRVTRERRTLKRPEPDAVLTGLRDVAADLRGRPVAQMARGSGKSEAVRDMVDHLRGAPVEPPFGCEALPPVGPLTSTEGLRAGDVLRVRDSEDWYPDKIVRVLDDQMGATNDGQVRVQGRHSSPALFDFRSLCFVGRPDADGWMTWTGGENPVPGAVVEAVFGHGGHWTVNTEALSWTETSDCRIVAIRLIDTPPAV